MRYWTTRELRVVRENMDRADREIAAMLGRTLKSVETQRLKHIGRKRISWRVERDNFLSRYSTYPQAE